MGTDENRENNSENENEKRNFSQVQVINRAATIMRAIRDNPSLNLSQLARKVGLPRTTVYRIVATLEMEGLLITDTTDGRIELGLELVSLGRAVKSNLRRELRPFLEGLSVHTDETVDQSIYENGQLIFIEQITRPRRLNAVSGVGEVFPLYCSANGKAILATFSNEEVARIVPSELEKYTENTLSTRDQLLEELEQVRSDGVAYAREEFTLGICAVGAAITGLANSIIAISIPVPSVRFYGNEEKFASALIRTCEAIRHRFNLPQPVYDRSSPYISV